MTDRKYNPRIDRETALIATDTDPWLQEVGRSQPVDLTQFDSSDFPAGVFAPVNDDYGIQRLDELDFYESDFDAAIALAEHLGVKTGKQYEVWFTQHEVSSTED